MVVMGFSFAVWVEGLDFGLRFPAKTILAGFLDTSACKITCRCALRGC